MANNKAKVKISKKKRSTKEEAILSKRERAREWEPEGAREREICQGFRYKRAEFLSFLESRCNLKIVQEYMQLSIQI